MARKGYKCNFSPLNISTEAQVEKIHKGTLRVLEETGLRIEHEKALKLLKDSGCKVDFQTMRVNFPPWLVEDALRKCPKSFRVKARNSKNDVMLGENTLYFSTNTGMNTIDLDTWASRKPTKKEFYEALIVIDALDNPQMTQNYYPWYGWDDLPPVMCIPEGFAARIRNTSKPLGMGHSKNSEIFTIQMAKAVGAEPMCTAAASPPLTYYKESIDALYRICEAGFPFRLSSGETMGATSPATLAGSVVTSNATILGRIILAQIIRPGTRISVIPWALPQNMRSGLATFGSIEGSLHHAAANQYWRKIGIPIHNGAGFVNSKSIDFQCGYERAISTFIAALSGANVIHLGGALYGELTLHPVLMVLDDDIAAMAGRFVEGVLVNDETLALDLINEVGPIPGTFLDKAHTRNWWKKERFMPQSADSFGIPEWIAKGKKSAIDYAKERMEQILATHKPDPLTPKQEEDVSRILKDAWDYYRKNEML